jgi:hypothetical protein
MQRVVSFLVVCFAAAKELTEWCFIAWMCVKACNALQTHYIAMMDTKSLAPQQAPQPAFLCDARMTL